MLARLFGGVLLLAAVEPLLAQTECSKLSTLNLPHTTITSAALVPEGAITAARAGNVVAPARCRVQAITRPSKDSEIRFEVWLPVSGWNGKYLQLGNGGWAGSINQAALADPLRRGYAVAATDDGHQSSSPGASWAVGHPEKLIDFGYRAVHETGVQAKAILHAFFGRDADRSYFSGCS
ncbi:MAG: tannase/feruloyl esterase family alpha/beta hydrolase, partial [Bryobacteraceae bacterium]